MKELTDLEICKRIAEIKRPNEWIIKDNKLMIVVEQFGREHQEYWNPITGNALNCQLRDEFRVNIEYWLDQGAVLYILNDDGERVCTIDVDTDEEINRAVCLCIIEAHKDE